jgi:hypothetical protein
MLNEYHQHYWSDYHKKDKEPLKWKVTVILIPEIKSDGPKPVVTKRTEYVDMTQFNSYIPEAGWHIESFKIGEQI